MNITRKYVEWAVKYDGTLNAANEIIKLLSQTITECKKYTAFINDNHDNDLVIIASYANDPDKYYVHSTVKKGDFVVISRNVNIHRYLDFVLTPEEFYNEFRIV